LYNGIKGRFGMEEKELLIIFRLREIDKLMEGDGATEVHGICSLTGKYVIRYIEMSNGKIFEFHHKKEIWVPLEDGVSSEYSYSGDFNKFILPYYDNNVIYLNHEKRKNI
jgi:hypothetical protein